MNKNVLGMRILAVCTVLYLSIAQLSAQNHDVLHWVYSADSVQQVQIDLVDPFEVTAWEGNQIMVSSEITLYNASKGLLRFFVEDDRRYDVVDSLQADVLLLDSYQSHRAVIQSKGQPCHEEVVVKIFMPSEFIESTPTLWIKKETAVEEDE